MKTWHILALFGVAGLLIYVVTRQTKQVRAASPSTGWGGLFSGAVNALPSLVGAFGKIGAPSQTTSTPYDASPSGTYQPSGGDTIVGNTLVSPSGLVLTYGTD